MMIGPGAYAYINRDKTYDELIDECDRLVSYMKKYERYLADKNDKDDSLNWYMNPDPSVVYQMDFEYLEELCRIMMRKYRDGDC